MTWAKYFLKWQYVAQKHHSSHRIIGLPYGANAWLRWKINRQKWRFLRASKRRARHHSQPRGQSHAKAIRPLAGRSPLAVRHPAPRAATAHPGDRTMNLHGLRRRLARWIYPEGAGALQPEAPSPRTAELLRLAEAFVRHHGFAELTHPAMLEIFHKWVSYKRYRWPDLPPPSFYRRRAASETIKRLFKHPSVCPRPKTYKPISRSLRRFPATGRPIFPGRPTSRARRPADA